jgi:hypothetical protein
MCWTLKHGRCLNRPAATGWLARAARLIEDASLSTCVASCWSSGPMTLIIRSLGSAGRVGRVGLAERIVAGSKRRDEILLAAARVELMRGRPAVAAAMVRKSSVRGSRDDGVFAS